MPLRKPLAFVLLSSAALSHAAELALEATQIAASEREDGARYQALTTATGASSLISHEQLTQQAHTSMAQALSFTPGVYAQSAGNEGLRLSLRGSGLNRASGAHGSGTFVLLDGLPLTGPGGTPYELQEALWLQQIEIYRGAQGLTQGALGLGGAINLISPTGYDLAPVSLRYEAGAHGWQKRHLSAGGVNQAVDYALAITDSRYRGFQQHAKGDSRGLMANVGYQLSPSVATRFYIRYRETEHQSPGRLTRAQIEHEPRAANALNLSRNAHRPQPGSTWLANKTTWQIDPASSLTLGLAWHHYPMDINESTNRLKLDYKDWVSSLTYRRQHALWGLPSESQLLLRSTYALPNKGARESVRIARIIDGTLYPVASPTRRYAHDGSDALGQLSNRLHLTNALWLDSSLALIYIRREVEVTQPKQPKAVNLTEYDYAPRLGLGYVLSPHTTLFANISRSVEPAHAWSMLWSSNQTFGPGSGAASGAIRQGVSLDSQSASTIEFGARGTHERLGVWEAAYYYADVRNEHLSTERYDNAGNLYIAESNASPTRHQGLELALDSSLGQTRAGGEWRLRQAYTLNHFRYLNDSVFGDNALPGIPQHRYQAELRYTHATGWYVAATTELSSRVATDYANSFYAGSYHLFGARAGINSQDQRLSLWLEGRNLSNTRYAGTVLPGYNDQGQDMPRSSPGEGRGFYTGISYHWR